MIGLTTIWSSLENIPNDAYQAFVDYLSFQVGNKTLSKKNCEKQGKKMRALEALSILQLKIEKSSILSDLNYARGRWKKPTQKEKYADSYRTALNYLVGKYADYFGKPWDKDYRDSGPLLKDLLDCYDTFINQQNRKNKAKQQQELLEVLQQTRNFFSFSGELAVLTKDDLDVLKRVLPSLKDFWKGITKQLLSSLLPIIYQYSQIKAQLRIEDQKRPLHEKDDDKHELYGAREDYQSPLASFEEKFFSQFKNLIDPKNKLNEEEIKNILEELTSIVNKFHHSILKPKWKRENGINPFIDHNEEIREEIALLEEAFNAWNGENPELRRQIAELRSLL